MIRCSALVCWQPTVEILVSAGQRQGGCETRVMWTLLGGSRVQLGEVLLKPFKRIGHCLKAVLGRVSYLRTRVRQDTGSEWLHR